MRRIAVISIVVDNPKNAQEILNGIISENSDIVKGRFGLPFNEYNIGVISITVIAEMDRINSITGKLGLIPGVLVKTAVSKKEI